MQSHNGLRRNRKALLSDLSSLVKDVRALQVAINQSSIHYIQDVILDELIMKAFGTVNRAIKFLDIWIGDVLSSESTDSRTDGPGLLAGNSRALMQPPAKSSTNEAANESLHEKPALASHVTRQEQPANNHNKMICDTQEQAIVRPPYRRSSHTFVRHGTSNTTPGLKRTSTQARKVSVSHRVSCSLTISTVPEAELASEKLSAAHDRFLGFLGSFIGLQLESRSSPELLHTTKQAVISCRDMLEIIEAIWERDAQRATSLAEAREDMYGSITKLAEAARNLFHPSSPCEVDELRMLDAKKPMVDAATACVRAAGECVAESRAVLERLGDFDFEPLNVALAPFQKDDDVSRDNSDAATIAESDPQTGSGEGDNICIPLQPTKEPPPPPSDSSIVRPPLVLSIPPTTPLNAHRPEVSKGNPVSTTVLDAQPLLPPLPPFAGLLSSAEDGPPSPQLSLNSCSEVQRDPGCRLRTDSFGVSSAGGSSTFIGSMRDSELSESSTRATSPDASDAPLSPSPQCESLAQSRTTLDEEIDEAEVVVQQKTFAHEIVFNKDGQISGGTLPALIERLTTHDSTPDAAFVATFYLTFRLFATPREFAQALIDRFSYVGDCPRISGPVRLRVYNVFKGWLESHWRHDADKPALELIVTFATRQLRFVLPTAGIALFVWLRRSALPMGRLCRD